MQNMLYIKTHTYVHTRHVHIHISKFYLYCEFNYIDTKNIVKLLNLIYYLIKNEGVHEQILRF